MHFLFSRYFGHHLEEERNVGCGVCLRNEDTACGVWQHGKIMSILGEEDKHIINIMSISGCKNAMKDQKRSGSLGYLPWQRVADLHPLMGLHRPSTIQDVTSHEKKLLRCIPFLSFSFGGGHWAYTLRTIVFAARFWFSCLFCTWDGSVS